MRLGINGSTIEKCGLSEFLEISARVGFEGVELRMPHIDAYLRTHSLADLRAEIDRRNLRVFTINSIENSTLQSPAGQEKVLAEVERFSRCAAELSCPWLVICPGTSPAGAAWGETLAISGRHLAAIADAAWKHRVGVAFEFLGFPGCSVKSPSGAWAVVKEANRGNLGIVVDVANFHSGRGFLQEISALPNGAVAVYHVNDVRDMRPEDAGAYDRVMPGDGVAPVAEITRELRRIGFNGIAAVEIFNHEYNRRDPFEVAAEAFEKTRARVE